MQQWVYDDPRYHIYAIWCACCPLAPFLPMNHEWKGIDPKGFLDGLTTVYQETLDGLRRPGIDHVCARIRLFIAKAMKKWKIADNQQAADRKRRALQGFVERNAAAAVAPLIPEPFAGFMREILSDWLPEPESTTHGSREGYWFEDITSDTVLRGDRKLISEYTACTGRFGPGQVAEKWTHPQRFARLLRWCDSPHWPEAPHTHPDFQHIRARLSAVPKDWSKDRLITVEPAASSFMQQHIRQVTQLAIHHGPLRGTAMDLGFTDGQAIQRRKALRASKTRKEATLDLSDASDNITWLQVQQVFPSWLTHLLGMARSTRFEYRLPGAPHMEDEQLFIYAGMGNGTTFTVETLFFAAFVKAYARAWGLPQDVSVFGDDIICSSRTAEKLMEEDFSFFRINRSKSFWGADALRESCGIFAYEGSDITVPKVDGYPDNYQGHTAFADLHSRLVGDGSSWARRLAYIYAINCPLPNWSFVFEGFPSIDDDLVERSSFGRWPSRWNKYTQCWEAKLPIVRNLTVSYSTDDRTARRHNHPPALVWYLARLCGSVGGSGARIRSSRFPSHGQCSISVPVKDRYRVTTEWVPAHSRGTCLPTVQSPTPFLCQGKGLLGSL